MATPQPIPADVRFQDLRDCVYADLTVIGYAGQNRHRQSMWICRCVCGREAVVSRPNLKYAGQQRCRTCGRARTTANSKKPKSHGMSLAAEYRTWTRIKVRCLSPKHDHWHNYGGRGITICPEWLNSFEAFFAHVGPRPSPKHSLDRIDNNGNYEPGNVRWATPKEQCRNTRVNQLLTYDGETLPLVEWSERYGLPQQTLRARIKSGWSVAKALNTPLITCKSRRSIAAVENPRVL